MRVCAIAVARIYLIHPNATSKKANAAQLCKHHVSSLGILEAIPAPLKSNVAETFKHVDLT